MRKRGKKETYYQRWRREHPRLQLYLSRDDYEWLSYMAERSKLSMKELVFEAIRDARKFYDEGVHEGYKSACETFILFPRAFYADVMEEARRRGIEDFEPCLFTSPCSICGKPMIFTHADDNYDKVERHIREAFKNWHHVKCRRTTP